ncbi:MAG TPA: hypothetical protein DD490_23515 [Acidobacteria bacterium]|nr:hypothetical protein [Acidobacteriota bacterium]
MSQTARSRFLSAPLLALALLVTGHPEAAARQGGGDDGGGSGGHETLKLRANDAIGKPGGIVAVVLRTYAARPIRQGKITVRVGRPTAAALQGLTAEALRQPVRPLTFLSAVVYSTRGDVTVQATPTGAADSQSVGVQFSSPSGTINASDGPLAVLRFRLDPSVTAGQQYTITVDPSFTSLIDSGGAPVDLAPINAMLTVRGATAPLAVEAEGDQLAPGETAELGFQTFEPFGISSGRVTLRYNAAVAAGPAVVRIDPRYGKATFTVDRSKPGILRIDFRSPNRTLNTVPGTIIAVSLPTKASAALGTESPVTLDPAGTWLTNTLGRKLKLAMENGAIVFE